MTTTRIAKARTTLAHKRHARSERARLHRELAAFSTPAERAEIEAIIARHPEEDTLEIQAILSVQAAARNTALAGTWV